MAMKKIALFTAAMLFPAVGFCAVEAGQKFVCGQDGVTCKQDATGKIRVYDKAGKQILNTAPTTAGGAAATTTAATTSATIITGTTITVAGVAAGVLTLIVDDQNNTGTTTGTTGTR